MNSNTKAIENWKVELRVRDQTRTEVTKMFLAL